MVRKVTLSVKIQAKVNFEGMGAKPLLDGMNNFYSPIPARLAFYLFQTL